MKFYKKSNATGFTLIDILLTSAIISLLSSITLFQVTEAKKKADDSSMKVEAQQVSTAISLYKNDHSGKVPLSASAEYNTSYIETDSEYQESMQLLIDGGYISEIPSSSDGQSYSYAVDENNNAFFAFKLKQGSTSSNKKNSCPVNVTNGGGIKTFTGCQYQENCVESSGVQCFENNVDSSDCDCNSQGSIISLNPSVTPVQRCAAVNYCFATIAMGRFIGYSMYTLLYDPPEMCTYTLSGTSNTPTCDGSSTADYCECI